MDEMLSFLVGFFVAVVLSALIWFNNDISVYMHDGSVVAAGSHNGKWKELPVLYPAKP